MGVCGVDVHKELMHVTCVDVLGSILAVAKEPRREDGLFRLAKLVESCNCRMLVMESTSYLWVWPYYRLKELLRSVKFVLVNPFSTTAYGKKTDELESDR